MISKGDRVQVKILNVGSKSVNCYLLVTEKAKLLINVRWPGGMQELKASPTNVDYTIKDVAHVLGMNYHMDHGGIAQEVKDKGARLIVMENHMAHLNDQAKFIRPLHSRT